MLPLPQISLHICCDQALADEFKRVVDQKGYSKDEVMQERMRDYIYQARHSLGETDREKIQTILQQDAATRMSPLSDKAADDLLQLAIRMAEKHI